MKAIAGNGATHPLSRRPLSRVSRSFTGPILKGNKGSRPKSSSGFAYGWFAFERGYHSNLVTPTGDKAYVVARDGAPHLSKYGRPEVSEAYPKFNAFVYSVETFVPLLKLQVSQYWIPNANQGRHCLGIACLPKEGSLLRWYTHVHVVAGWVLTTLWVGGLAGSASPKNNQFFFLWKDFHNAENF
jgi:hypothetical protein